MINDEVTRQSIEMLDKIVTNILQNDIDKGKCLLKICECSEIQTKNNFYNCCDFNHKQDVINYIANIEKRYEFFVKLYILINSKNIEISNEKLQINCKSLSTYIFILEEIKKAKDTSKSIMELLKIERNINE